MKTEKNTRETVIRTFLIAIPLAVFFIMLCINFMTPLVSDDFAHYFGAGGEHPSGLSEILTAMRQFRNETNGRVVAHFVVYMFLGLPKWVFNIVNALVAALLPIIMMSYYGDKSIKTPILLLINVMLLWYFIQSFGQVFLWLTGACNYLWGLCLFLLLIYPFYCDYVGKVHRFSALEQCVLALICGAYSESGAAATGFTIGALTILIWIKEKRFPIKQFLVCLFALAGFLFLMTAPATATRTGTDYIRNIWYIRVCLKDYSLILIIAYVVLFAISLVLGADRRKLLFTVVLSFAGLLSVLFFIFAAYLPARSFYVINSFLILSCLILLAEIFNSGTYFRYLIPAVAIALTAVFVPKFVSGIKDIAYLNNQKVEREAIASEMQGEDAEIPAYTADTMYPATYEEELSEDRTFWYNDFVAKYYGFNSVIKR